MLCVGAADGCVDGTQATRLDSFCLLEPLFLFFFPFFFFPPLPFPLFDGISIMSLSHFNTLEPFPFPLFFVDTPELFPFFPLLFDDFFFLGRFFLFALRPVLPTAFSGCEYICECTDAIVAEVGVLMMFSIPSFAGF
jgi:hypothetical protein